MTVVPSNQKRSRLIVRTEAVFRLAYLNLLASRNKSILLTEFPKSGGTWLCNMMSDASGTPFPQNRFPTLRRSLFHGHYIRQFSNVPTVVLWRDPRDVVVSWYFHSLVSQHTNESLVSKNRSVLGFEDYQDIRSNLPAFIKFMFTDQSSPNFSWNEFFDFWSNDTRHCIHTSYERLHNQPEDELKRILWALEFQETMDIKQAVTKHSFQAISGRAKGQEDSGSFLRKGVVGDWKNQFSEHALLTLEEATKGRLSEYDKFASRMA